MVMMMLMILNMQYQRNQPTYNGMDHEWTFPAFISHSCLVNHIFYNETGMAFKPSHFLPLRLCFLDLMG